jgi:hypothetical protein
MTFMLQISTEIYVSRQPHTKQQQFQLSHTLYEISFPVRIKNIFRPILELAVQSMSLLDSRNLKKRWPMKLRNNSIFDYSMS